MQVTDVESVDVARLEDEQAGYREDYFMIRGRVFAPTMSMEEVKDAIEESVEGVEFRDGQ